MKKYFFLIVFSLFLLACENRSATTNNWERDTNTRTIRVTDSPYQDAVQRAQTEIITFKKLFTPTNDSLDFFVNASFTDENGVEHMWIDVYSLRGDIAYGTIGNDAIKVKNVRFGDSVSIDLKKIEDFTVYRADSVVAGDFLNHSLGK